MALKEKCSNPLMSLVIILVLLVVALITAVIVLRLDKNPRISGPPEELRNATNSPESLNPQKNKIYTLKPSDPPKIQPTNPTNSRPNIPNFKPRNVCESPECITLAHQLLETLIQKTSKRVLANFLIINYIDLFTKSLLIDPDDVGKCDEMATDNLPEAGFSVIVKNHFDRENIQIVSDLVEEIKIVLKN
ncbi:hypothetical protein L5515_015373 [Caenorhabditis briggsae]|uniref:Uncharacterized protein n=1 Tax=Caenorhabditis briggsae TaxID=6238 RepID=A0AAE9EEM6_CAEBR|nr:hypothetical protein L5515_015373 [Caenorhabditis briggsae]